MQNGLDRMERAMDFFGGGTYARKTTPLTRATTAKLIIVDAEDLDGVGVGTIVVDPPAVAEVVEGAAVVPPAVGEVVEGVAVIVVVGGDDVGAMMLQKLIKLVAVLYKFSLEVTLQFPSMLVVLVVNAIQSAELQKAFVNALFVKAADWTTEYHRLLVLMERALAHCCVSWT
ncbi:hypothetical protein AeRB84_009742 [Aphanomyces euteiches]|nr:hypothetical protein AeRB84_009742 [Aphanomyces euteiches]